MLLWLFSFLLGTPTIYPLNGRGAKMARIRRNFYRRTDKKVSPKTYKATCVQYKRELLLEVQPTDNNLLCADCFSKKGDTH